MRTGVAQPFRAARLDLEIPIRMRAHLSALEIQRLAAREDDRQGLDPAARAAVLERRRAGGVGRHDAAREGGRVGGEGRVVAAGGRERLLERADRHARLHAHAIAADLDDRVHPRGRDDDLAHRRRAAGHRRLRADRQNAATRPYERGDLALGPRTRHARGVSARIVRRVFQVGADRLGFCGDKRRCRGFARRTCPDAVGRHAAPAL